MTEFTSAPRRPKPSKHSVSFQKNAIPPKSLSDRTVARSRKDPAVRVSLSSSSLVKEPDLPIPVEGQSPQPTTHRQNHLPRLNGRSAIMRCPEMPHRLASPFYRGGGAACGGYIDRPSEPCQQTFAKKCSDPTPSSRRPAQAPRNRGVSRRNGRPRVEKCQSKKRACPGARRNDPIKQGSKAEDRGRLAHRAGGWRPANGGGASPSPDQAPRPIVPIRYSPLATDGLTRPRTGPRGNSPSGPAACRAGRRTRTGRSCP